MTIKKFLLLITTLFTLAVKAQTSVYHPFPDSNTVWNIHFWLYCFGNGTADENYSITIQGDTLISSQTYHKLTTPYVQSFSTGTCGGTPVGYKGAVRQDTANKKVFFVPPSDSLEHLLYDFNMQAGDTVKGYIESFAFPPDIVQSIDSVLVGSNYRKRWNINPWYNISFIEGIGSTYGLIEKSPGAVTDFPDYSITCFAQDGITLYPDTTTNCEIITHIKNSYPEKNLIFISPNPFHTVAFLELSSEFENAELKIYNTPGFLIREEKISHQKSFILNRNGLHDGIYFIQLVNNKGQAITGKFIVD